VPGTLRRLSAARAAATWLALSGWVPALAALAPLSARAAAAASTEPAAKQTPPKIHMNLAFPGDPTGLERSRRAKTLRVCGFISQGRVSPAILPSRGGAAASVRLAVLTCLFAVPEEERHDLISCFQREIVRLDPPEETNGLRICRGYSSQPVALREMALEPAPC